MYAGPKERETEETKVRMEKRQDKKKTKQGERSVDERPEQTSIETNLAQQKRRDGEDAPRDGNARDWMEREGVGRQAVRFNKQRYENECTTTR